MKKDPVSSPIKYESSNAPEFYRGSPVDSQDLRYREEFIHSLWEAIVQQHVLLTAPRRTGKTSIMDHLRDFPQHDFIVLKENVQDLAHPADFFASLLARFHDEHPKLLRDSLSKGWKLLNMAYAKIEEVGFSEFKVALRASDPNWRENWRQHGEKLLSQLRTHGTHVLIVVDELPDMLLNLKKENPQLLREFLAWFRSQRLDPTPKHDPIRWLIGGSVNLSSTLDAEGLVDLINDLDDIPLPVLTDDQVSHFVSSMLSNRGVKFTENVPTDCLKSLGRPIPLFMQMLTQDLHRMWKKRGDDTYVLDSADVDEAFHDLVRSSAAQDKLQHYYSRLGKYYQDPKLSAAHAVLNQLSLLENGLSRPTLKNEFLQYLEQAGQSLLPHEANQVFNQLLRDLANDFYIEEISEDHFDFASGVLKSWWRKYYA